MLEMISLNNTWRAEWRVCMSCALPSRTTRLGCRQLGLFGLALAGTFLSLAGAAHAADIYSDDRYGPPRAGYEVLEPRAPVYARPAYPPPVVERRVEIDDGCRVFHRRRIDPYGREVIRRVRVCEDTVVQRAPEPPPYWASRPPRYGEDWDYAPPRPPRAVAPDDED
jgi:hypothetical protein